jgi:hypothetical protein
MSWIFGIIGSSVTSQTIARCQTIHSTALGTYQQSGKYYLAAGGLSYTCMLSHAGSHQNLDAFGITLVPFLNSKLEFSFFVP